MDNNTHSTDVDRILAEQRDESDARSIINEVERINMLEGIHQYRWIWELLQNARDEAGEGVDIKLKLYPDEFRFEHNGKPFKSQHLLAMLRKTSTKPINGAEGNSGKFGTGFVTSHLLNKIVRIEGVHENLSGKRRFSFTLDRTPEDLGDMKQSISNGIQKIRDIDAITQDSDHSNSSNSFYYKLGKSAYQIALGGMDQLKLNLPFAMLVNSKLNSISVEYPETKHVFTTEIKRNVVLDLSFIQVKDKEKPDSNNGLLFYSNPKLTIAVPVSCIGNQYTLNSLEKNTRLFKDLPLIGTEEFYIPVILQHENFQPTEPRDGVRTKIALDTDEKDDKHATSNRNALKEFVSVFPQFVDQLVKEKVNNLHFLAESGCPPNADAYYGADWYYTQIQKPIREVVLSHDLVKTVSGKMISISEAKFAYCESGYAEQMFELLSKWYPDNCPNENSYKDWIRIIEQETDNWPAGITVNIEQLVKDVAAKEKLENFEFSIEDSIKWLQDLVAYLEVSGYERLGHDYSIYPSQDGALAIQNNVFHDIDLDKRFKSISEGMGRRLQKELLPIGFRAKFIEPFDAKEFLLSLNLNIGTLQVKDASEEQIQAVIDLCGTFKVTKAEKREQWYRLLSQFLPDRTGEKIIVNLNEEYQWEPAEKCALKYVCHLVQFSETLQALSDKFFEGHIESASNWLNDLYDFVFRNEENKAAALTYAIIPTQDNCFKVYTEDIYREEYPFDDMIKSLYKEHTVGGDPKTFLVDTGITNKNIRTTNQIRLSRLIDDLFNDRDSEDFVKEGQKYHNLFLKLKEWTDKNFSKADEYFPIFCKKQPVLYIKAFGGGNFSRLLKLKKPIEELEKLDNLNLSASEMKKLDDAVAELGSADQLIEKAKEMIISAELARWRKEVGTAAEDAFVEAIGEADSKFLDPENPDVGRDFVIRIGDKEYSIELKSAIEGKETVKMSITQGAAAVQDKDHYALCVISRPFGEFTDKQQFIDRARFVPNIGDHIGDKVENWKKGVSQLDSAGDVRVELDSNAGAVNIRKGVWKDALTFDQFVKHLKQYFE
ncbi:MAG: hypothetical protein ACJASQ_001607 [Crocinitomicaceae bacterium]|jgi:hypothetical protein